MISISRNVLVLSVGFFLVTCLTSGILFGLYSKHRQVSNRIQANKFGEMAFSKSEYGTAARHYNRAVSIADSQGIKDHGLLFSLRSLCESFHLAGETEQAIPVGLRALNLSQELYGQEAFDTAATFDQVGLLMIEKGEYEKSEDLLQKSLEIKASMFAERLAFSMACLGKNLFLQKKYVEAESLFRQELAFKNAVLGEHHHYNIQTISNLVLTLQSQGKFKEAKNLLAIKAEIMKNSSKPSDFVNNNRLNSKQKIEYKKTEPLFRRSLELFKPKLGFNHPKTEIKNSVSALIDD